MQSQNKASISVENVSLEAKEKTAAVTIQKNFRGFLARKKYGIQHLKQSQQESYRTFVVGNDPIMPTALDNYHEPNDKIALIATSGMRAVSLACKIGNPKNTPKIILIDNSIEVNSFWHAMREFMQDEKKAATQALFLQNLPLFLDAHRRLYRKLAHDSLSSVAAPGVKYLNQDISVYFKALIRKYGYEYIRAVILHAALIKQSWVEPNVLVKVKNILNRLGIHKIYMYPSNIASYIDDENMRDQFLENIAKIQPVLSIHTDHCDVHCHPEKVYLFENNDPKYVTNTIFSSTSSTCKPKQPNISSLLSFSDLMILLNTLQQSTPNNHSYNLYP